VGDGASRWLGPLWQEHLDLDDASLEEGRAICDRLRRRP
jgi:hypothetical protein